MCSISSSGDSFRRWAINRYQCSRRSSGTSCAIASIRCRQKVQASWDQQRSGPVKFGEQPLLIALCPDHQGCLRQLSYIRLTSCDRPKREAMLPGRVLEVCQAIFGFHDQRLEDISEPTGLPRVVPVLEFEFKLTAFSTIRYSTRVCRRSAHARTESTLAGSGVTIPTAVNATNCGQARHVRALWTLFGPYDPDRVGPLRNAPTW